MAQEEKSITEIWAENEVAIYCKEEADNRKWNSNEYVHMCAESALKAFKCLLEDGHSGGSMNVTRSILDRLLDLKPLTPISDTDDMWDETHELSESNGKRESYQCNRMFSLFKTVYPDGTVTYRDLDRFVGVDENGYGYHFSLIDRVMHEMFPVEMPYMPDRKPYKIYTEELQTEANKGSFNTIRLKYVITPKGERHEIERYFAEDPMCEWVEIDKATYQARTLAHKARIDKEFKEFCKTAGITAFKDETEGNE